MDFIAGRGSPRCLQARYGLELNLPKYLSCRMMNSSLSSVHLRILSEEEMGFSLQGGSGRSILSFS